MILMRKFRCFAFIFLFNTLNVYITNIFLYLLKSFNGII